MCAFSGGMNNVYPKDIPWIYVLMIEVLKTLNINLLNKKYHWLFIKTSWVVLTFDQKVRFVLLDPGLSRLFQVSCNLSPACCIVLFLNIRTRTWGYVDSTAQYIQNLPQVISYSFRFSTCLICIHMKSFSHYWCPLNWVFSSQKRPTLTRIIQFIRENSC